VEKKGPSRERGGDKKKNDKQEKRSKQRGERLGFDKRHVGGEKILCLLVTALSREGRGGIFEGGWGGNWLSRMDYKEKVCEWEYCRRKKTSVL